MSEFEKSYPDEYDLYSKVKGSCLSSTYANSDVSDILSLSEEEILQSAIEHKRLIYSRMYNEYNQAFCDKYKINQSNILFLSSYAPFVIIRGTNELGEIIKEDADVISINPFVNEASVVQGLSMANSMSRANIVRDSLGYQGSGVKMGIVESGGVPDTSDSYLQGKNIIKKSGDNTVDEHATIVARILIGTDSSGTNDGFAPLSSLYCCIGANTLQYYSSVEWLISSGVNIINASLGFAGATGSYASQDAWTDHIAVAHDIHFVVASGNDFTNTNRYVSSPALGYNVISVGGVNSNGAVLGSAIGTFTMADFSCYVETGTTHPEKPNVVAESVGFWGYQGTSMSAPQVAGTIAQLCSFRSSLKVKQTAVGAIIMASAAQKIEAEGTGTKGDTFSYVTRVNSQISKKEGAGLLDSRWAWGIVNANNYWSVQIANSSYPYTKTVSINASANSVTRVCIFWLKKNSVNHTSNSVSLTTCSNLNLYVYGPSGNLVGSSATLLSNYEIVQFVPTVSGTYTIKIEDLGSYSGSDYVGIAVW